MFEIDDVRDDVVALRASGRVTPYDYEQLAPRLDAKIEAQDKVNMVIEVDDVRAVSARAVVADARMVRYLPHVGRVAFVSDKRWLRGLASASGRILLPDGSRAFPSSRREEAIAWAAGEIVSPPSRPSG